MVLRIIPIQINRGNVNVLDIPQYLSDKYAFNEHEIKDYIKRYSEYSSMKKVLKVQTDTIMKQGEV